MKRLSICLGISLLMVLLPLCGWGRSVSGTVRGLVLDGNVTTGATPGSNGGTWETDELLEGFQGAVNWFMSWDDDYLYLGRIGGNNTEGAVMYLHGDYAGASYASQGYDYDQLAPQLQPMGGANFVAYARSGYNEWRHYNNGWGSPGVNLLGPSFGVQSGTAHMEMRIAWNDITGGNGKPDNFRVVLYQVVPAGITCPQEFVYGESPWGTGNPGDGPSTGLNDGVPTSARQPGGCNVGDSTATRWWGCYPVRGGIGPNNWAFSSGQNIQDSTLCMGADSLLLESQGAGVWTQVGGPVTGGIADPNSAATLVGGLSLAGTYTFVFSRNQACETLHDTLRYRLLAATALSLGADTSFCAGDTLCLSPSPGVALGSITWSDGSQGANLCVLASGSYWFSASDTNGCPSRDTIAVSALQAPAILSVSIDTSGCPLIVLSSQYSSVVTSIDWDLGLGQHQSTATAMQDYSAWGNGSHAFTLTVANGCGEDVMSGVVEIGCLVGVDEELEDGLALGPNPSDGRVRMRLAAGLDAVGVLVMDAKGSSVGLAQGWPQGARELELDLGGLPTGLYYIQLRLADGGVLQAKAIRR